VPVVRGAGQAARPATDVGAGSARGRSSGDAGVGQAGVGRCHEPLCAKRTWSETHEQIRPRCVLTELARREACRRVGEDGHTVASVAAYFGIGWGTIMAAVRDHGQPLLTTSSGSMTWTPSAWMRPRFWPRPAMRLPQW
jgi:hypothetical protein